MKLKLYQAQLMFHTTSSIYSTKLKERSLLYHKITDIVDLQETYTINEILGKGNFGTVIKAEHKESKIPWAIKIINKRQAGASRVMLVQQEIHLLKLVDHPHIIFLDRVYESSKTIYLVFELCSGSLAKIFHIKKIFTEQEVMKIIHRLSTALAYLHKNDIVHRDLKLENILIADNPNDPEDKLYIKVTDFGLSTMRRGPRHDQMLHGCCGTPIYMAPEMITTNCCYSQQCDVWSMGIIMYVLLFGTFPFSCSNQQQLCSSIRNAELDFSGKHISKESKHLLNKLLEKNPAFRISAAEVEHHPWITGFCPQLFTTSSNALDMMRMWRKELSENTSGDIDGDCTDADCRSLLEINKSSTDKEFQDLSLLNPDSQSEHSGIKYKKGHKTNKAMCILYRTNKRSTDTLPFNSNRKQTIANSKHINGLRTNVTSNHKKLSKSDDGTNININQIVKYNQQGSSQLPDFSNVSAKIDTNLPSLRKCCKNKRNRMENSVA